MTARACERDGCEVEVTGRSTRCPEHQAEHRREAESARKRQARNADKCGQAASAFAAVSPDDADREAKARAALERFEIPADLIERTKADPGAPYLHAEKLAKMRREAPADWARAKAALKAAGVTLADLERAMGAGDAHGGGKQGQPVEWHDPEPWPKRVDGAALLDVLVALLERYASLPDGGAVAVALWALYTWTFRAFAVAPNLMITAPERESGKTRVTELLSWAVPRAKPVSDASAAAIIRGIERDGPTLLFDEAQHFLNRRQDDPIRGILLAGFTKRFATVERCEGDAHEVRVFSTFCPKAMNGRKLATIDDMLTSRSVVIPMMRARKPLPELRADRDPVGEDIRRKCARWRDDHLTALGFHAEDQQADHGASTRADAGELRGERGNPPVRRWIAREGLQARGVYGCVERLPARRGRESNRDTVPTP